MRCRTVYTILRKELLETLRDKKTLIAMIGLPVVLYPLLIIVVGQVAIMQVSKVDEAESVVAVMGDDTGKVIGWLEEIDKIKVAEPEDPETELLDGELDAIVVVEGDVSRVVAGQGAVTITIEHDFTETSSREALRRVRRGLRDRNDALLDERLEVAGIEKDFVKPIVIEEEDVAPSEKTTGSLLGLILPYILIITIAIGAFYPAVDLTAGEKERGTFETLLATPTSKTEIVWGKFLTVVCISMISGLLNLGSMIGSLLFLWSQVTSDPQFDASKIDLNLFNVSPVSVVLILIVLVPLAFLICSVMMSVALLAKDFKEAQNFLTPVLIVIVIPGVLTSLPGSELSSVTVFIPIANVSLLFKDLLVQKGSLQEFFTVLISTSGYAIMSLVFAVWLFQREDVILAEDKGIPLAVRRSNFVPRTEPTLGMSLMLFSLALLLTFYIGIYVQGRDMISGLFITEWCLLLLPTVGILWYTRVDLLNSLNIKLGSLWSYLAAPMLAIAVYIIVIQVSLWQETIMPMPPEMAEEMKGKLGYDGTTRGLIVLLLAVAVSPAVCEEILFRGAVLSGFRNRLSPFMTIMVVSVLFGVMHMDIYRFSLTTVLGIAMTYLVLRSGSIFPGMLFHFLVNGFTILSTTDNIPASVLERIPDIEEGTSRIPFSFALTAAVLLIAGVAIIETVGRDKRRQATN